MKKIAIISDIHGNLPALQKVLEDLESRNISDIYCLGDLVDFAPWGNEVIDLIKAKNIPCLLGNHDERIAYDLQIIPLSHHSEKETANRFVAINHSKKYITEENKQWLGSLPLNLELTVPTSKVNLNVLLVHASLNSNDEYVFEKDNKERMLQELKNRQINIVCMGHTHYSYIQKTEDVWVINVGSVGRSKEVDRKATYGIITFRDEEILPEIVKVDYNINAVADAIYKSEIPDFYADFLLNLD